MDLNDCKIKMVADMAADPAMHRPMPNGQRQDALIDWLWNYGCQQMARCAELEAQNQHDDEADTAMRNLLSEENDALRARVAELEVELKDSLEEHSCYHPDGDGPCPMCRRLAELNRK